MIALEVPWYCAKNGGSQGPFTFEDLRGMAARGDIAPSDHIWNPDMTGWIPASEQPGLFPSPAPSLAPAPPSLPLAAAACDPFAAPAPGLQQATRPLTARPAAAANAGAGAAVARPVTSTARASAPAVDPDVEKGIRNAVVAACISGGITALFTLIALAGVNPIGLDASAFVDVTLIFGLAYGVHRRSRACAVILLVYFIASKIYMMSQAGAPTGLPLAIVFIYYYFKGVQATFQHHAAK